MAVYWVSFRINDDGAGDERQYGLLKAIQLCQRRYWDRTGGFVVFESEHTLRYVSEVLRAQIDPSQDLFILGEITGQAVRLCGANTDRDIITMLPQCQVLAG
jgi:hypothetical protein